MSGRKYYLTHLEEVMLLTILRLQPRAYVSLIQRNVAEALGHPVSHGVIYYGLEALERIGFVKSHKGEPKRGRNRRYYTVKVLAVETLKAMAEVRKKLAEGLRLEVEE